MKVVGNPAEDGLMGQKNIREPNRNGAMISAELVTKKLKADLKWLNKKWCVKVVQSSFLLTIYVSTNIISWRLAHVLVNREYRFRFVWLNGYPFLNNFRNVHNVKSKPGL